MNPVGLLVLGIGIMLIVVGIKGTQHNVVSAVTNLPKKSS